MYGLLIACDVYKLRLDHNILWTLKHRCLAHEMYTYYSPL